MHSVDNAQRAKEDCGADAEEDAQQNRHGPFVGKIAGNLHLEGIIRMVGDQLARRVHRPHDCFHRADSKRSIDVSAGCWG